ncbi:MAG: hypothetical protein WD512_03055, partial [Candidatus Paceibacterota bacterium]
NLHRIYKFKSKPNKAGIYAKKVGEISVDYNINNFVVNDSNTLALIQAVNVENPEEHKLFLLDL